MAGLAILLNFLVFLFLFFFYGQRNSIHGIQLNENLPERQYINLGDINIGGVFSVTQYSSKNMCGKRIRFPLLQQYIEAIVYAIDEINRNTSLLPNITLGYVILDDCVKQTTATSQALRFLPRKTVPELCAGQNINCLNITFKDDEFYDVIGIIGPQKSENSVAVSYVLDSHHVPQISFIATSDELSNKEFHSYFLRLVPSDVYQTQAIMSFIVSQGWVYVSLLYSEGSYGEKAYLNIKTLAEDMKVCIATQMKTSISMTRNEYKEILTELLNFPRARVVIAFLGGAEMAGVFTAVVEMNITRKFIWIGSDGWAERLTMLRRKNKEALYGAFTTLVDVPPVPDFNNYFSTIKPSNTKNPWFNETWERQFNCSFAKGTCDESKDIASSPGFYPLSLISSAIDSVYVYAYALQAYIDRNCPGVQGSESRKCIIEQKFFPYLKEVNFQGYSGRIKFDINGDVMRKYVIRQIRPGEKGNPYEQVPVKLVDATNSSNITMLNAISWDYVAPLTTGFGPNAIVPLPSFPFEVEKAPLSVCSRLCGVGEFIVQKDPPCCWECQYCRDNEITVNNNIACQTCPIFTWPDPETNLTACIKIPPDYPVYTDAVMVFEICTSCVGLLAAVGVLLAFIYYRDARVIKAASKELSFLQLVAITAGYTNMLVYVAPPNHITCSIAYWLFCFSFDLLYAPLLVKAIRIYRIFHAAAKGNRGLKLVSPLSQVVISCCIVMGQVTISTIVTGLQRPTARLTQPVQSERFVELSCDITLSGLSTFLSYNLTLLVLCTVFAFKTRKLPDNFNESRFMSMCVTTTLVIWLAFIPTFLTSSRQYLKTLLLALALLLNHSVALIFLFISKLYAVVYLKDEPDETFSSGRPVGTSRSPSRIEHSMNCQANSNMNEESHRIQL